MSNTHTTEIHGLARLARFLDEMFSIWSPTVKEAWANSGTVRHSTLACCGN